MFRRTLASRRSLAASPWRTTFVSRAACLRRCLLTKAHDVGPTTPPLFEQTIPEHFASIVSAHGDRPAVHSRHQQTTLTYADLDQKSNALARGLQSLGVRKGDRIAVSLGNNIEFAITTYALFKIGAVLNPLNPSFNVQQVIAATSHLEASHLIIGAETNLARKSPRSNVPLLEHIAPNIRGGKLESEVVPSLQQVVLVDNSAGRVDVKDLSAAVRFQDVIASDGRAFGYQGLDKDDVVNIQFTSGTTSMPKAACLTHKSILNNGH